MCPARRTVNGKSICPASVNHVSYRVRSRDFCIALDLVTDLVVSGFSSSLVEDGGRGGPCAVNCWGQVQQFCCIKGGHQ